MKKGLIILSILTVSMTSFSAEKKQTKKATTTAAVSGEDKINQTLDRLADQLDAITAKEKQIIEQKRRDAIDAKARVARLEQINAEINEKIVEIEENAKKSIFGKEMNTKAKEFKSLQSQVIKEQMADEKIINEYNELAKVRGLDQI